MANILIIDDDELITEAVQETLRRAGHSVAVAQNGRDGLVAVARARPDLVITDVLMPGMDGIEVIRALQAGSHGIPVIAMSGGGLLEARTILDMAAALGAAGILPKPFSRKDLLELVARCLGDAKVVS